MYRKLVFVLLCCCASTAHAAFFVNVGSHLLLPNTPGQAIPIYVSGGDLMRGIDLIAQVGDGGPVLGALLGNGAHIAGPSISVDLLAPGSIFSLSNTGAFDPFTGDPVPSLQDDIDRQAFGIGTQVIWAESITNGASTVAANGLLADLIVDTTGFFNGLWPLFLSSPDFSTFLGIDTTLYDFNFSPLAGDILNGSISIVPEPGSIALAGIGLAGLCLCAWRRSRLRPSQLSMLPHLIGRGYSTGVPCLRMTSTIVACLSLFTLCATSGSATTIIDQDNLYGPAPWGAIFVDSPIVWEQEVTAGVTGTLAGIDLLGYSVPRTFELFLAHGPAWQSATPSFVTPVSDPGSPDLSYYTFFVDTASANFQLSAGDKFVIGLQQGSGSGGALIANVGGYDNNLWFYLGEPYNEGPANALQFWGSPLDLAFRTHMVVPEPSAIVLAGLGMAGLAGLVWRRRVRAARPAKGASIVGAPALEWPCS